MTFEQLKGMRMSVPEAAAISGESHDTIRRAIVNKRLKASYPDTGCGTGRRKRWRVRGEDLWEWMERHSNKRAA